MTCLCIQGPIIENRMDIASSCWHTGRWIGVTPSRPGSKSRHTRSCRITVRSVIGISSIFFCIRGPPPPHPYSRCGSYCPKQPLACRALDRCDVLATGASSGRGPTGRAGRPVQPRLARHPAAPAAFAREPALWAGHQQPRVSAAAAAEGGVHQGGQFPGWQVRRRPA